MFVLDLFSYTLTEEGYITNRKSNMLTFHHPEHPEVVGVIIWLSSETEWKYTYDFTILIKGQEVYHEKIGYAYFPYGRSETYYFLNKLNSFIYESEEMRQSTEEDEFSYYLAEYIGGH